jgi:hypothetical protein
MTEPAPQPPAPEPSFALRVGGDTIPARGLPPRVNAAELAARIEEANQRRRLAGLPDELNPDIVDPAKAAAFASGLAAQPDETLGRLAGRELALTWEDLGLLSASPTRVADFAAPFRLVIDEVKGPRVWAHTTVTADPARARAGARAAEAALSKAHRVVTKLDRPSAAASGDDVAAARLRRSAILRAWLVNARAWLAGAPEDPKAKAALAAAEALVDDYVMPRGDSTSAKPR